MNSIIYMHCDIKDSYNEYSFLGRIKDRLKISLEGEAFIKELGIEIAKIKLPPNINKKSYISNIQRAQKRNWRGRELALKTSRTLDYDLLSSFQQDMIAYSVVKSIQLVLRIKKKSIKNSCIVIYDASDNINNNIIFQLAKEAKYLVLLSENIKKCNQIREYVSAYYGVCPVLTNDVSYALKRADFIVASKHIECSDTLPAWYIDNMYIPKNDNNLSINDVTFFTPWSFDEFSMVPELLGAILGQMEEREIEKALKYNGIYIDQIKFNDCVREY